MNPSTNAPIYYGPSNLGSDGALLAGIANKQYDYAGMLSAGGTCDLRSEVGELRGTIKDAASNIRADIGDVKDVVREEGQEGISATKDVGILVKDAECRLMNKLGDVECKIIKENSDQTLYLTNQLSVIREQGIRNEYETKLSREQVIKEVSAKVGYEADRTQDKVQASKDFNAEKFCDLSKQLAECCCEQELSSATQVGLLNVIANALNVGGVRVAK